MTFNNANSISPRELAELQEYFSVRRQNAIEFPARSTFDREQFLVDLRRLAVMNIPWLHQGDDPNVGFDCIGVVKYAVELQMKLPDELVEAFSAYHRPPNGRHMLEVMRRHLIEIQESEVMPADLLLCYVRRNSCHVAVQMENGMIAEAFEQPGTSRFMIRPMPSDRQIAACFRIPDFAQTN